MCVVFLSFVLHMYTDCLSAYCIEWQFMDDTGNISVKRVCVRTRWQSVRGSKFEVKDNKKSSSSERDKKVEEATKASAWEPSRRWSACGERRRRLTSQ